MAEYTICYVKGISSKCPDSYYICYSLIFTTMQFGIVHGIEYMCAIWYLGYLTPDEISVFCLILPMTIDVAKFVTSQQRKP